MIINLNTNINFMMREPLYVLTSQITVIEIIDKPSQKKVIANVKLGDSRSLKTLILWEGVEYDNVGQWTDNDAQLKIKEICESYQ